MQMQNCTLYTLFSFAGLAGLFLLGVLSVFLSFSKPKVKIDTTLIKAMSVITVCSLTLKNMSGVYFKRKPDGTIEFNFNSAKPLDKKE